MDNSRREVVAFLLAKEISGRLAIAGTAAAEDKPVLGNWGIEKQFISKDIKPGDDFYRFVNEGWLKTATPPPGLPFSNALTAASLKTQAQLSIW